jgi:hypothetical protein
MRGGKEMEDTGLHYLVAYESGEYSVVTEREIFIDPSDSEIATIYFKGKPYAVEIIRKGTSEKIKEKEDFFRNRLSVNTSEEESSRKLLKARQQPQQKSRLNRLESDSEENGIDGEDDRGGSDDDFMVTDSTFPLSKKIKTSNLEKKSSRKKSLPANPSSASVQPSSSKSSVQPSTSKSHTSPASPTQPASPTRSASSTSSASQTPITHDPTAPPTRSTSSTPSITHPKRPLKPTHPPMAHLDQTTINRAIQDMQGQIDLLTRRNLTGVNASRFIVTGVDGKTKDIVDEIFGKNFVKWMSAVASFMFTEDEIMESTLVPTNRTSRAHLDEEKVALMREALVFKYKYDNGSLDKAWAAVIKSINNKGRNIKLKRRTRSFFSRMTTSISKTFSSNVISNEQ